MMTIMLQIGNENKTRRIVGTLRTAQKRLNRDTNVDALSVVNALLSSDAQLDKLNHAMQHLILTKVKSGKDKSKDGPAFLVMPAAIDQQTSAPGMMAVASLTGLVSDLDPTRSPVPAETLPQRFRHSATWLNDGDAVALYEVPAAGARELLADLLAHDILDLAEAA